MDSQGKIRIIGGKWRGRKIDVVNADGLRPSPDRTRETLFNWLQGKIKGARCLDLFAGSGILGFEALSRGASEVLTVELNTIIAGSLRKTSKILQSDAHKIVCQDALSIAEENLGNFDLIFLDPPFNHGYVEKCCQMIIENSLLKSDGVIYIESEKNLKIPSSFIINKIVQTGQVQSVLAKMHKET